MRGRAHGLGPDPLVSRLWFARRKWRQISTALYERGGVPYHPDKCKTKMDELTREYLNYDIEGRRTGSPGLGELISDPRTRECMLLMEELWRGSVVVKPKISISAGLSSKIESASVSLSPACLQFHILQFLFMILFLQTFPGPNHCCNVWAVHEASIHASASQFEAGEPLRRKEPNQSTASLLCSLHLMAWSCQV